MNNAIYDLTRTGYAKGTRLCQLHCHSRTDERSMYGLLGCPRTSYLPAKLCLISASPSPSIARRETTRTEPVKIL